MKIRQVNGPELTCLENRRRANQRPHPRERLQPNAYQNFFIPVTPIGKAQTPVVQQNIFDFGQSSVSQRITQSASNMRLSHAEYQARSAASSPQSKAVDNVSSPSLLLNRKKSKTPVIICTEPSPLKTRSGKTLITSPCHDNAKPTSSVLRKSNSPHSKYNKSTSSLSMT